MARTFFIGDTHFGHKLMESQRPFATLVEHDRQLIQRWNAVVEPGDRVFHLGDVVMNRCYLPLVEYLNGKKELVLGNHDGWRPQELLDVGFVRLHGATEFKGFILTHIPVHESQFSRFRANIHGHLHSKVLIDLKYICVSAEQINYTPTTLEEVEARLKV